MKIIKQGILPQYREWKGKCYFCGTEFECLQNEGEYAIDQRDGDYLRVNCPICEKQCALGLK
ncbi:hypothetical protein [Burkholderia gladioli]|uniref:hypothetical protein n=1 Tax=Burkholderia gladioli TaxID=28095 RepID=UPI00164110D5|nr:hypothetical protein [Burkholderia gladioli]